MSRRRNSLQKSLCPVVICHYLPGSFVRNFCFNTMPCRHMPLITYVALSSARWARSRPAPRAASSSAGPSCAGLPEPNISFLHKDLAKNRRLSGQVRSLVFEVSNPTAPASISSSNLGQVTLSVFIISNCKISN